MNLATIQGLIDDLQDDGLNTAAEARAVLNAIKNETCKLYQVIELDIPAASFAAYMLANFDTTGLGIGDSEGLAWCNGNNGTQNRKGRVSMCYDPVNYPLIGSLGGNKDAVVIDHEHFNFTIGNGGQTGVDVLPGDYVARRGSSGGDNDYRLVKPTTSDLPTVGKSGKPVLAGSVVGVSGGNKNLQPYLITLMVQRIS